VVIEPPAADAQVLGPATPQDDAEVLNVAAVRTDR
jgi:hypothetical protein